LSKLSRWLWALATAGFAVLPLSRAGEPGEIVFASYNLENYFQASDFPDEKEKISKSPDSIAAEIRVIQDIHPDILGVCEMGPPGEFADFKARLKAAGLDYPETEYVQGPDPQRHVALLSKYPISSRQSLSDVPYAMDGREEKISRGILDVTISVGDAKLRFIGVHLKSKLKDTIEDESDLRRNEAHLLRKHMDDVLDADPATKLVVYGDFNDTKNEPCLKEVLGGRGSARAMRDLWLKDTDGDHWTEYWNTADVYSRIDYILVTRDLLSAVDYPRSYIYRSPYWNKASDHRAVVAALRLEKAQ
jgi:endonuclease/exonuclease/phosphatase family metal-dependent hydrolase